MKSSLYDEKLTKNSVHAIYQLTELRHRIRTQLLGYMGGGAGLVFPLKSLSKLLSVHSFWRNLSNTGKSVWYELQSPREKVKKVA